MCYVPKIAPMTNNSCEMKNKAAHSYDLLTESYRSSTLLRLTEDVKLRHTKTEMSTVSPLSAGYLRSNFWANRMLMVFKFSTQQTHKGLGLNE